MANDMPYMRLWVDDLLSDVPVIAMRPEEFGVYMKLLCLAWKEGGVPADLEQRARLVGISPKRLERLWPAMESRWVSDGNGRLYNPRQERERAEAKAAHNRRVRAGRKGGRQKAKL